MHARIANCGLLPEQTFLPLQPGSSFLASLQDSSSSLCMVLSAALHGKTGRSPQIVGQEASGSCTLSQARPPHCTALTVLPDAGVCCTGAVCQQWSGHGQGQDR
jgi:hypothetical protein